MRTTDMDEQVTQTPEVDAEAQAIAEATAGYEGKARAPVESVPTEPLADSTLSASEEEPEDEPTAQAEPVKPADAIAQHLEDLKAQVKELAANKGADADAVRKMHGEIGNINRTLQELKSANAKPEEPVVDEMTAALEQAEAIAQEFPELAGPLVNAIKVLQKRLPVADKAPEAKTEARQEPVLDVQETARRATQEAAIAALDEVHPDRHQIKESAEFKAWYANWKTPEFRKKVESSWNPAVVASPFTDFKATLEARKRKQQRLEAAATPQGMQRSAPSAISDEEAARIGYERGRGKRL